MTIDYIKFHSIPKGGKAYIFEIQQRIQEKGRKRRTGMQSPFDVKNKAASAIDRLALRLLLFALCVSYFYVLWRSLTESLIAGTALFALAALAFALWEKHTLSKRNQALRERLGGAIALQELVLMPSGQAAETVCALLCHAFGAEKLTPSSMRHDGQTWHIRISQCLRGSNASAGDVLAAHRAREEQGSEQCVLLSTGGFTPDAVRAAEWVDPPICLIAGTQLSALLGRLHPATDEEIARHAKQRKKPYSFARIKALALAPQKLRRYLLCALLLLLFYLTSGSMICLFSSLLALLLAKFCHEANRWPFPFPLHAGRVSSSGT